MEAVYRMEWAWEGPHRLLCPTFLSGRATRRPGRPTPTPIDTSIANQTPKETRHTPNESPHTPSASPGSTQSTPYPTPFTALTTPPDSPVLVRVKLDVQQVGKVVTENRELRHKVNALEAHLQDLQGLRRMRSVWVERYMAEVARNREAEQQLEEGIRGLVKAADD